MTIFDYLTDIQVTKYCSLPVEDYNGYMVARWLSFYSPKVAHLINETVNIHNTTLDKQHHYKWMSTLVSKSSVSKRINYIKKVSEKKEKENINYVTLAHNLQISQRELKELLEFRENNHKIKDNV